MDPRFQNSFRSAVGHHPHAAASMYPHFPSYAQLYNTLLPNASLPIVPGMIKMVEEEQRLRLLREEEALRQKEAKRQKEAQREKERKEREQRERLDYDFFIEINTNFFSFGIYFINSIVIISLKKKKKNNPTESNVSSAKGKEKRRRSKGKKNNVNCLKKSVSVNAIMLHRCMRPKCNVIYFCLDFMHHNVHHLV